MSRLIWFVASLVLALGVFSPAAWAQTNATASGGERRTVVVSVVTQNGQLVNGLGKENFRAALGGQDVAIISAQYDTAPHRVVFLLDVSGSMQDKRDLTSLMVENLLNWIGPQNPIAVLAFAKFIKARVPFSTDRASIRAGLENPKGDALPAKHANSGLTALFDALDEALELFSPRQPGDTICLVSDGGNNSGKLREYQAKRILPGAGVRIFSILIEESFAVRGRTPEESYGPSTLSDLSKITGAEMVTINSEKVRQAFGRWPAKRAEEVRQEQGEAMAGVLTLSREMNAFYRLEIELPAPMDKPRGLKLEVLDPATGKPDHKLILHYPSKLYPIALKSSDK